jgi:hypothetical protein
VCRDWAVCTPTKGPGDGSGESAHPKSSDSPCKRRASDGPGSPLETMKPRLTRGFFLAKAKMFLRRGLLGALWVGLCTVRRADRLAGYILKYFLVSRAKAQQAGVRPNTRLNRICTPALRVI